MTRSSCAAAACLFSWQAGYEDSSRLSPSTSACHLTLSCSPPASSTYARIGYHLRACAPPHRHAPRLRIYAAACAHCSAAPICRLLPTRAPQRNSAACGVATFSTHLPAIAMVWDGRRWKEGQLSSGVAGDITARESDVSACWRFRRCVTRRAGGRSSKLSITVSRVLDSYTAAATCWLISSMPCLNITLLSCYHALPPPTTCLTSYRCYRGLPPPLPTASRPPLPPAHLPAFACHCLHAHTCLLTTIPLACLLCLLASSYSVKML